MTFEEWDQANYQASTEVNWITNGIERGNRHAGWEAGQRAMRDRSARAIQAWGVTEDDEDLARLVNDIRALPVE